MAGKKPAKVNSGNKKQNLVLPGKTILYYGGKGADPYVCPTCKRSLIKGIIYEHVDNIFYCKRVCIPN